MNKIITLFIVCLYFFVFSKEAHAYIDPGTGTYIMQLIVAFIIGGVFFIKTYWRKIQTFLANFFSKQSKEGSNSLENE